MSKAIQLKRNNEFLYPISQVYSDEEVKIGIWVNGKPLYRKLIFPSCPSTTEYGTYATSTSKIADNIDTAFIEWSFIRDNANQKQPLLYVTNAGYVTKAFIDGSKQYYIANNNKDYNNCLITASILYTKTTD